MINTCKSNLFIIYDYNNCLCNLHIAGKYIKKSDTVKVSPFEGRLMGLEPTALGTTIRCSNQLSYNLRLESAAKLMNYFYLMHVL